LSNIRRLVLDVLKPLSPSIIELAKQLADTQGVDGVDVSLVEMDTKSESVKITCEGENINYKEVEAVITDNGGSVHSVDKVSTGSTIIEEVPTHQDTESTLA